MHQLIDDLHDGPTRRRGGESSRIQSSYCSEVSLVTRQRIIIAHDDTITFNT